MATVIEQVPQMDTKQLQKLIDARLDEVLPKKLAEIEENKTPTMAIIATKGTLDWAYPPFILASTGAALGWDVKIFFTFYGLLLLKKDFNADVSPLGNPAMPMKMPFGPKWFQNFSWPIPNAIMAGVPGFEKVATGLMKQTFKNKGVASIEELRSLSIEAGVEMIACQMTVDVFGFSQDDFIPEVKDYVGAASFLPTARNADVCLFI
ncbi:NADH dehydrogenase [Sulfurifustis variabilis]|uniref:NADH dehydrogenase n=1 Tax=Sulfurifustis variabilis TaxID=1675686 RepID=A0A1B4V3B4_9GAMM|nr:DsrE/DsrF/DrsH-like family protein [Sulfurifustis variabilis]BAU48038.1 NADH dehydrogenase [Sulfurifustis variabilis]